MLKTLDFKGFCNNNCLCCQNDKTGRISLSDILSEIKKVKYENLIRIRGFEFTIDKDFVDFFKKSIQLKKSLIIETNGRMFSYKSFCDKLTKTDRIIFEIKLFGHDAKTHDFHTRAKGSFDQTVKGIENLIKKDFLVDIVFYLTKYNYKYIQEVYDLASNLKAREFDIKYIHIFEKKDKITPEYDEIKKILSKCKLDKIPYQLLDFSEYFDLLENKESPDLILIHPPNQILNEGLIPITLPVEHHCGSSLRIKKFPHGPPFNILPLGFSGLKEYIENNSNYKVRIENLASNRLNIYSEDRDLFNEKIQKLSTSLYGVSINWIVHCNGSIKTLELIKKYHPDSFTVVGGITASVYAKELMKTYKFIDFVVVGDSELPLKMLLDYINGKGKIEKISNLYWRKNGKIIKNKHKFKNNKIGHSFIYLPLAKGCPLSCIHCGLSFNCFKKIFNYNNILIQNNSKLIERLLKFDPKYESFPLFFIHDPIITIGEKKWSLLLREIRKNNDIKVKNFTIEFFYPHSKKIIDDISRTFPNTTITISPDSINQEVRAHQLQRSYSNKKLISNIKYISKIPNIDLQIWFTNGLALQTQKTISENLTFIKKNVKLHEKGIHFVYTELVPLDPGSLSMNSNFGYNILFKSFRRFLDAYSNPFFKSQINYETKYMDKDQVFDSIVNTHINFDFIKNNNNLLTDSDLFIQTKYNKLLLKYSSSFDKVGYTNPNQNIEKIRDLCGNFILELNENN